MHAALHILKKERKDNFLPNHLCIMCLISVVFLYLVLKNLPCLSDRQYKVRVDVIVND